YDTIAHRIGPVAPSAAEDVLASYTAGITDEFIEPVVIGHEPDAAVRPGDVLLFYNFRAHRMRKIVQAFALPVVSGFGVAHIQDPHIVTYTEYMENLPVSIVFCKESLKNTLAEVLSTHGLRQYHSAETEKYPH